jgi:hypothetical protein
MPQFLVARMSEKWYSTAKTTMAARKPPKPVQELREPKRLLTKEEIANLECDQSSMPGSGRGS